MKLIEREIPKKSDMLTEKGHKNSSGLQARLIFEIILVLLVFLLALALIIKPGFIFGSGVKINYITPNGTFSDSFEKGSEAELRQGPEINGYTFIGWRDAQGNIEHRTSINVWEDTDYSAVYSVAFDTKEHMTFLDIENGLFRPEDALTNRECAIMLYKLMNINNIGSGEFTDVSKDDSCYKAAATLKDLGVLYGSKFHPDEGITKREFLDILKCFYPADFCEERLKELENDEQLSRKETAKIMCALLERTGDSDKDIKKVGTILDVSLSDPDYWVIAESGIPHEPEMIDGLEKWVSAKALPIRKPGYFYIGAQLHLIDENGSPVTDKTVDGLYFNKAGAYTSGNNELDALVQSTMTELLGQNGINYQDIDSLKTMYRFVVDNFEYKRRNYYKFGETGWAEEEAFTMITTGRGNCYNFAALFYEFARALGFNAKIYSGTMGPDKSPHAWVEIEINGENRLFDPEYEYSKGVNSPVDMFNREDRYLDKYKYKKAV